MNNKYVFGVANANNTQANNVTPVSAINVDTALSSKMSSDKFSQYFYNQNSSLLKKEVVSLLKESNRGTMQVSILQKNSADHFSHLATKLDKMDTATAVKGASQANIGLAANILEKNNNKNLLLNYNSLLQYSNFIVDAVPGSSKMETVTKTNNKAVLPYTDSNADISSIILSSKYGDEGMRAGENRYFIYLKKSSWNIFKSESSLNTKESLFKEILYINKSRYNSIDPLLSEYKVSISKYLKSFYNFDKFVAKNQFIEYKFNKNSIKCFSNLETFLKDAFYSMFSLISKPILEVSANKIIIHLFFFFKNSTNKYPYKMGLGNKNRGSARNKPLIRSASSSLSASTTATASLSKAMMLDGTALSITGAPVASQSKLGNRKLNFIFKNNNMDYSNFIYSNNKKLQYLSIILSKYFKKPVLFQLTRIHHPILQGEILAQSIGILGNKLRKRFKFFVNYAFKSANIDNPNIINSNKNIAFNKDIASSNITGIKIKLGGRLLAQKIIPKFSSLTFQEGSLTRSNALLISKSRFSSKNKKGAFSITVSIGHSFF